VGAGLPAMQALPMHGTGLAGDRRQAGSHKGRFDASSDVRDGQHRAASREPFNH